MSSKFEQLTNKIKGAEILNLSKSHDGISLHLADGRSVDFNIFSDEVEEHLFPETSDEVYDFRRAFVTYMVVTVNES